jgi:hypothetical protein
MQESLTDKLRRHRNMLEDAVLIKDDNERGIGLQAINSFSQIGPGAEPSRVCLEALARAARSHESHVAVVAADLLYDLAANHEDARTAIRSLSEDSNEGARFWAISAATMHRPIPNPFVVDILRRGLSDQSPKVSMHAAQKVAQLKIKELLPALLRMFSGLKDPDDLEWCELYIDLVRNGYRILPLSGGDCHMSIQLENGDLIGWMGKESEVEVKGPDMFAKQIAQQFLADEAQREAIRVKSLKAGSPQNQSLNQTGPT